MSPPRRRAVLAAITALILAGCAQVPSAVAPHDTRPPAESAPLPPADDLPLSSYFTTVHTPLIDGAAAFTGEVARPNGSITVHDNQGYPIATVSSEEALPVIGRSVGWIRVMLPSRRALPGEGVPVNGGTGWISESGVVIEKVAVRFRISLDEQRLDVLTPAGDRVTESFPALIGSEVPLGPTFVAPGGGVAECGTAPINLIAQSEVTASYRGQPVSPVFIAGPTPECGYTPQEIADIAPRSIQLAPEHLDELAALTVPGTFVGVVSASGPANSEPLRYWPRPGIRCLRYE
ncbi:hypothetical protein ASH00_15740 [Arthrobacter sp. Soil782]|uniref:hypothetical protein n=1 Tax=Arthrobacter sp. Soil782 TaxID=1736410 RepID=UPI0006F58E9F|nr:hypothetical protein [Arthrobacter sp. Soil782]KRF03236.1 hypothetical protein ASH00_15740 [Arthrobacter sp. Soil782]